MLKFPALIRMLVITSLALQQHYENMYRKNLKFVMYLLFFLELGDFTKKLTVQDCSESLQFQFWLLKSFS